jgi:hypothetical protein
MCYFSMHKVLDAHSGGGGGCRIGKGGGRIGRGGGGRGRVRAR